MSNDNLQGMPPALPTQQNMPAQPVPQPNPPVAPKQTSAGNPNPQPSDSQPQGSYYQQLHGNQPRGSYYRELYGDQPQQTPGNEANQSSPYGPNHSPLYTPKGPATMAGATLTAEPHNNLRNMLAETFVQCVNFKDCTTLPTWWFGQIVLYFFYLILSRIVGGSPILLIALYAYCALCRIALCTRRINDTSRSGSWMWLPTITVVLELICIAFILSPESALNYPNAILILYWARFIVGIIIALTFGVFQSTPVTKYTDYGTKPRYINYV